MPETYFTIAQQTGPRRAVRLAGRGGPYEGTVTFSGTQRHEKTLYGGSPDASIQIQGPDEDGWSPQGMWSDRYMTGSAPTCVALLQTGQATPQNPQGTQAQTAVQLAQFIDLIRREGQVVRVSYDVEVRYGVLVRFGWTPRPTMDRVEWQMEFVWSGRSGQPSVPAAPQRLGGQDFASGLSRAVSRLQDLTGTVQNLPGQFPLNFQALQQLRAGVTQLGQLRDAAYNTLSAYAGQIQSALDTTQSLLTTGADAINDAANLAALTQQHSYRVLTGLADLGTVTAGQYVAAAAYARQVGEQARSIEDFGVEFLATAQANYLSDVVRIRPVRAGEDLRSIALDEYGNPQEWRAIAAYNGLRGPGDVLPGESVFIPRILT